MYSVTQRIRMLEQPRGGYLPAKMFDETLLTTNVGLHAQESISPALVGLVVDYLTRFMDGDTKEEAFRISLIGAKVLGNEELGKAITLLSKIEGLDKDSIYYACKLVGYDSAYRAGPRAYRPVENIIADEETVENIQVMVERSLSFLAEYGPTMLNGFTLGKESMTHLIGSGDGDFLTEDTLWDFKVSKYGPTKDHALQLMIYYLMGRKSKGVEEKMRTVKYLGIYNPRLNAVYRIALKDIDVETIRSIETEVIGY